MLAEPFQELTMTSTSFLVGEAEPAGPTKKSWTVYRSTVLVVECNYTCIIATRTVESSDLTHMELVQQTLH